jgi:branched-chain amino acid transport system substrate-binding protein
MRKFFAILAVAVGSLSIGLPTSAGAADEIIAGFAIGQTGLMQPLDVDASRMALLYFDELNAHGGLLGKKVRPVIIDTKSDMQESAKAGAELVKDGAAVVFTSCDYDFGAPAALQAQRAGVISVFLCAGDPKAGILGVGPLSFTAGTAAQSEGASLAEWGYDKQGYRSAYILLDNSIEYDKSVCAGFEWAFAKRGGQIAGKDTFKNGDASIASQVTRLTSAIGDKKVNAVVLCSYPPGGASAVRQLRAAGIKLPILAGSAMDGSYWLSASPDLGDFYTAVFDATAVDDPRPEVKALTERYKAKFGSPPATMYAYPIYGWLQLWTKAVGEAGTTDGKAVVKVMETYKGEPTLLGPKTYTSKLHIQVQAPLIIKAVTHGEEKFVTFWKFEDEIPNNILFRTQAQEK